MDDSWIFEESKKEVTSLTGEPLYWFEPEEIEVYEFDYKTHYVDCREETAVETINF